MDDTDSINLAHKPQATANMKLGRWKASLALNFNKRDGRTFLAKKQHSGPLVIQKTLHPEGDAICHGIIIHPPGGVAGGDEITLQVALAQNANVLLTTPGAGKWYKANSKVASQHLQFDLAENTCLEWLPQENILFDGSMIDFSANINLDENARYAGWEVLCFGRQARGESWDTGKLSQNLIIKRGNKTIWQERTVLMANDRFFNSIIGLGGNVISASFVIVAGTVPVELFAQCQQLQMNDAVNEIDSQARYGVTVLPEVFSARYIGMSAPAARQYFEKLWHILRPWYLSHAAVRPRIWNT
ncbi:MAG: urease accessory protein UreD [Methylotenera sp.]|nr:urease accessory protein UreD [Methylococcaceae bacterium]MDP3818725.1 urease accessory protein UreD [Methylotenera sp.]